MRKSLLVAVLFIAPFLLSAQNNLQLLGHLPYDTATLAGCGHYVDHTGGEWGLVGTGKGLSIVDVSNPAAPAQKFYIPQLHNLWREIKTWNGYAYAGSEISGSGITIVDLHYLPDSIRYKTWFGDSVNVILRSHTVQAQDGYLYINGGGNVTSGTVIADLIDPWNPHIVGKYADFYVHDCFVRGDTMWTSEIYTGQFSVVKITDKSNPQYLVSHPTPFVFNHNSWLSDDSKTLYTTDEKAKAPLGAFDVSDLNNITLIDTYYPSGNPSAEVHNVRVLHDFLINPSYGGQLTVVDGARPNNLIEIGFASLGSSLVWDADPFLPSGIILATAVNEGLYIYKPTYQRAAYLEGKVTDATTNLALFGAKVLITGAPKIDSTDFNGLYKTGIAVPGDYVVTVSKPGYQSQVFTSVALQNGQVTILNVALQPEMSATGQVEHLQEIRVYPNIAHDHLMINLPEGRGASLSLIDDMGRVRLSQESTGTVTEVSLGAGLSNGLYILLVRNSDGTVSRHKIIKE
jgi:choice-of-anchor B domain-containing protein